MWSISDLERSQPEQTEISTLNQEDLKACRSLPQPIFIICLHLIVKELDFYTRLMNRRCTEGAASHRSWLFDSRDLRLTLNLNPAVTGSGV